MSEPVKKCPSCGSVPTRSSFVQDGVSMVHIYCPNAVCEAQPGSIYPTDSEAIASWNRTEP